MPLQGAELGRRAAPLPCRSSFPRTVSPLLQFAVAFARVHALADVLSEACFLSWPSPRPPSSPLCLAGGQGHRSRQAREHARDCQSDRLGRQVTFFIPFSFSRPRGGPVSHRGATWLHLYSFVRDSPTLPNRGFDRAEVSPFSACPRQTPVTESTVTRLVRGNRSRRSPTAQVAGEYGRRRPVTSQTRSPDSGRMSWHEGRRAGFRGRRRTAESGPCPLQR